MLNNISPVLIGWVGPIIIVLPYTLLLGRWMASPGRFAVFVYAISIITGVLFDVVGDASDRESAIIAGVTAPIIYCLLLSVWSIFYRYFIRKELVKLDPEGVNWVEKILIGIGGAISGSLVGGVLGLLVGAVFNFIFLALINFRLLFSQFITLSDGFNEFLLEAGIYLFGLIGMVWGGMLGAQTTDIENEPS